MLQSMKRPKSGKAPARPLHTGAWRLEQAKAQVSEVVRRARTQEPQHVTVRGQDGVMVIAVEELERLLPSAASQPLVSFLQSPDLGSLDLGSPDLDREHDVGRNVAL